MRTILGATSALLLAAGIPAAIARASAGTPAPGAALAGRSVPSAVASAPAGQRAAAAGTVRYELPVDGPARVIAGFDPPLTRYGPGHRGVDLAVTLRGPVRAAGDGIVRFAGLVAGRGVVVVEHASGITTEYEPLRVRVTAGLRVLRGAVLGSVSGRHGSCRVDACLHWGARRGGAYFDPMTLLAGLGPVRLIPWAG